MPESEAFNAVGKLKDSAIEKFFTPSKIPNMSLNLLGGAFKPEHIKFNPKGEAAEDWNGYEYIFLLDFYNSIEIKEEGNYCAVFFWVKDIHNCSFPAKTTVSKESRELLESLKLQPIPPNGAETEVLCSTQLSHVPTRCNFWHTQFAIIAGEGKVKKPVEKPKSGYQRNAAEYAIKDLIAVKGKKIISDFDLVPQSIYKRER